MLVFYVMLYVIIGACIGSFYLYLNLKADKCCDMEDAAFMATGVGAFWPVVAPFAFGFYFARVMSERSGKK